MEGISGRSSTSSSPSTASHFYQAEGGQGRLPLPLDSFQSKVDEGFWRRLSSLKLNTLGIDDSPINITGFFAPCSHPKVSQQLTLLAESLPPESGEQSPSGGILRRGNRNRCPVPGILYNTNTLERFNALDRTALLKMEANKIWEDIFSGKVEEESAVLLRFLVILFADSKKWELRYWFAFPALMIDPLATLVDLRPASQVLSPDEAKSLSVACKEWRDSSLTTDVPFFLVCIAPDSRVTIRPLKDWEACQAVYGQKLLFGFYDPCHRPNKPGWPLRNFLAFICLRWKTEVVPFFCYREERGYSSLALSLIGEASVSLPPRLGRENGRQWVKYSSTLSRHVVRLVTSI